MAQSTDIVLSDQLGAPFRAELNQILSALGTDNSGNSEPLNTYQFMKWVDTSNATYYYIKERNHDDTAWVTLFRYTVATKIMEAVSNGVVLSQTNIASEIHASSSKTTPVDADEIGLIDSASTFSLKKLTWANLKDTLKTYFDTLYVALSGNQTIAGIKTFSNFPITPSSAPTTDYQVANKKYADDLVSGLTFERVVRGTAVNSTSGTAIDFTGLPSWAKEIEVIFKDTSTTGSSNLMAQLGSTTIQTTGYTSQASLISAPSTVQSTSNTTGFHMQDGSAGSTRNGSMKFENITGNIWVASHVVGNNGASIVSIGGGNVTLGGVLDRLRITSLTGTDTFDLGQINYIARG